MYSKFLKENQLLGGDWEPKIPGGGECRLLFDDKTIRLHFQDLSKVPLRPH